MPARHYKLWCRTCDRTYEDDGFLLACPTMHEPTLLAAAYEEERFEPDPDAEGVFRYRRWLPGTRTLANAGASATYRSDRLGRALGLRNLWVVFNGYWPERRATIETATFKELEAWTVLSRIPERHDGVLVIASAGNTAAAFARTCSMNRVPCLIVIPSAGLANLQFAEPLDPCVRVVSLGGFTDYSDAIALANRISSCEGFFPEGGVRNVARLDGLGTTVLNATETVGRIPDYYFQAIGSGAGAIGVYHAAKRLTADGRFGAALPRLMLSQNLPFVPIYLSWKSCRRELIPIDTADAKRQIQQIGAQVLSNRQPPYSVRGGVFDILTDTGGDMLVADNFEADHARRLFEEIEGIDIDPASAVAFATLIKAARAGGIERDAFVLLNITGGGRAKQRRERSLTPVQPSLQLDDAEVLGEDSVDRILGLFR